MLVQCGWLEESINKNTDKTATGKSWTMGNQMFTCSGELDNGMNVSLSFVMTKVTMHLLQTTQEIHLTLTL